MVVHIREIGSIGPRAPAGDGSDQARQVATVKAAAAIQKEALDLGRDHFIVAYDHPFLVKHPKKGVRAKGDQEFDYATRTVSFNEDPLAGEMQIVPVRKNPDNPFPDRLTIGRAPNCDIVLRLAFISKVHAHLFMQPGGKLVLRDNKASNGTFVNHRRLDEGGSCNVELGDMLSLGFLDLELVDASRLFDILEAAPRLKAVRF